MPGLPVNVPQRDRISLGLVVQPRHPGNTFGNLALGIARGAQATQVTLDIRGEHRDTGIAEGFCQPLQGDGFPCPGSACHQPVTICQAHGLGNRLPREIGTDNELR
ncbi:hydrophilic protein [Pseudomonas chlororaphis subsp. aurantiaca]|nr:hydrophilic protein [Pseudomonas chlororaphis subsp. aurantiaca]